MDEFNKIDDYWQAVGGLRRDEQQRIRSEFAQDEELQRLFALLDRLGEVREMMFELGSREIGRPGDEP